MLKLLVVDDELVILQGILKILREGNTPFTHIESAQDAFEALSLLADFKPDVIITDITMPEMNGLEATGAIRAVEREWATHTPIVGVTAHALKGDRERCLGAGMDDYLPKPISPRALQEKIEKWVRAAPPRMVLQ